MSSTWPWAAVLSLAACRAPLPDSESAGRSPGSATFQVEPYLWVPSLAGDVPDDEGNGVDVDLVGLEDLEAALMLAAEAQPAGSRWALLFDSLYVRFDNHARLLRVETGAQLIEAAAAYDPAGWNDVEVLAGLRYWRLFADLDLASVVGSDQEAVWVDPFVGIRATRRLGDAWSLSGRADVGGFGVRADWIYQLQAGLNYELGEHGSLALGYRYLAIEFDDFGYDAALAGPTLGLRWSF